MATKDMKRIDPRKVFTDLLKATSGADVVRRTGFSLFYTVVGFKGVKDGLGTSTIVANTALALARVGLNVCVVDTSILNPCQDVLLKTDYFEKEMKDRLDWFDMGFTKLSVLHQSRYNSSISVLSFQDRNIIDLLSTKDDANLVSLAFDQLGSKFDIILVDLCNEPTNIATTAMQLSQKVIQVWSNAPQILMNVPSFMANNVILSCPTDKTRYVVTSMNVDDIPTDWEAIFKKYNVKHLAHVGMSLDIARVLATGKPVYDYASRSEDIQEFNDCVIDIACHLLGIQSEAEHKKGSVLPRDLMKDTVLSTNGVEYKDDAGDFPEITTTLEQADAMLDQPFVSTENSYTGGNEQGIDGGDAYGGMPSAQFVPSQLNNPDMAKPKKRGLFRKGGSD